MSTSLYRDREIQKIITSAFKQFNISDPNEMTDISNSIKSQLDSSSVASTFSESLLASSSSYRADVRGSLIDIIAQLLYYKDLSTELNQLEGQSRWLIDSAASKLMGLEKKLLTAGKQIKESFEEGIDSGIHDNTIVKDGYLRVDKTEKRLKVGGITIKTSPASSRSNKTYTEISGDPLSLLGTGIGSDLYTVNISTTSIPHFYYNQKFYEGMKMEVFLETEEAHISAVSAKCSNIFRIISIEGYNKQTESWDFLGEDETLGQTSYINVDTNTSYSTYKVVLHSPHYEATGNTYKLSTILHNIKLFQLNPIQTIDKGYFTSHEYPASFSLFKIKFDASYEGNVACWAEFTGRPDLSPFLILPKDETDITLTKYYDGETSLSLPVIPDQSTIVVQTATGTILESSYNSGDNSISILNEIPGQYVFISFTVIAQSLESPALNADLNEALVPYPLALQEAHDKIDGFIFPLKHVPWRPITGEAVFTITFNGEALEVEEISIIDGNTVSFDDTKNQFYYFNKSLYTNFDLLALGTDIQVDYKTMCDGVKIRIDLSNNDIINEYFLELLEIEQEVFVVNSTITGTNVSSSAADTANNSGGPLY